MMNENPYAAPAFVPEAIGILSGSSEDLRKVAKYQKGIIACIAIYLVGFFGQFVSPPELLVFAWLIIIAAGFAGAVFVFLLAIKVFGIGLGILFGALCFFPCLGIFVLLGVNSKATHILKENGIKVGLFGALNLESPV